MVNDAKILKYLSSTLKILSLIIGILFIAYGLFSGVLGQQVECNPPKVVERLIALFFLLLGVLYFILNSMIQKNHRLKISYLIVTISPIVLLLNFSLYEIITDGWWWFVEFGGLKMVLYWFPMFLLAPLSLIFFILSLKDS